MSSQKGNVSRNRAQKHKNTHAFKNDLHDCTPKTKFLNSLEITDVCPKCKGVLDWRIKFKKYKLLKNATTCTKCHQKNVTSSYRIMCKECAEKLKVCPKCGLNEAEQKMEAQIAKHGKALKPKTASQPVVQPTVEVIDCESPSSSHSSIYESSASADECLEGDG